MNIRDVVGEYAWRMERRAEQERGAFLPTVVERTGRGERAYDLFSRLLEDRIVFLGSVIDDVDANLIVAQLLYLQSKNKNADINMYVNSLGGAVTSGLAIYDTMQFVQCDVATFVIGQAASMGAILLAAGTKGKRYALPHSRVMLHQPWGGARGTAADISIQAEEILRLKRSLNEILVKHTGQPLEKVEADADRDFYIGAEEAVAYGIVDEVLTTLKTGKR